MNQVNRCWLHVGIPTMFTIHTGILNDKHQPMHFTFNNILI